MDIAQLGGFDMEVTVRLVGAALLGALLGLERSLAGKHAGMRTYALVSLGSCLFTVVGVLTSYQFALFAGVNPLHLAGSVIIGIGFIGAGLSALRGEHPVELTTATGLWVVAGVGMAVGFGMWGAALASTVLAVLIFSLFARIEYGIRVRYGKKME